MQFIPFVKGTDARNKSSFASWGLMPAIRSNGKRSHANRCAASKVSFERADPSGLAAVISIAIVSSDRERAAFIHQAIGAIREAKTTMLPSAIGEQETRIGSIVSGKVVAVDDRKTIDSTFMNAYAADMGDGIPEYTIQTQQFSDGNWHVFLFNFAQNAYEDLAPLGPAGQTYLSGTDRSGMGNRGWDLFEYYGPANSPCAGFPLLETTTLQIEQNNTFQVVTSDNSQVDGPSSCFADNGPGSTSPYYTRSLFNSANSWSVTTALQ